MQTHTTNESETSKWLGELFVKRLRQITARQHKIDTDLLISVRNIPRLHKVNYRNGDINLSDSSEGEVPIVQYEHYLK
jgi:hypothetical protein